MGDAVPRGGGLVEVVFVSEDCVQRGGSGRLILFCVFVAWLGFDMGSETWYFGLCFCVLECKQVSMGMWVCVES